MATEEEEFQLISDYVVAILKSPTWVSPISKFVDDNCGIFEDIEENKLEYTIVHNHFKNLVDNLLVAHLVEMSLSTEQFMRFCERGLCGNNELHRSLVEQLISVEDFMVFKAMMVKRSCEINREVLNDKEPPLAPLEGSPTDEAADEQERLEAERRCVEAELQLAEALSLQLEKRLQLMEALDEVLELVSKIYKIRADALEQQVAEEKQREQEMLQQAAADNMIAPLMPAMTAPAGLLAPVKHTSQLPAVISSSISVRPLCQAPAMHFLDGATTGGAAACHNLEYKKAEAAMQKERAERASDAKRQEPVAAPTYYGQPQVGLSAPAAPLEPTAEEKQQRTEHLKRQRAALIEKKNRERESNLTSFQMQHGATNASCVAQRAIQQPSLEQADPGKLLAQELSGLAPVPTAAMPDPNAAALEMRKMLTKQLRNSFQ